MFILPASASPLNPTLNVAMVCPQDMRLMPLELDARAPTSILKLVYESLVTMDDQRNIVPNLAESYTYVGGNMWEFTLRQGITFHDGSPLTAQDAVDTLNAISALAKQGLGQYRQTTEVLADWEAKSEFVLRVRAKNSSYATLYAMTFPVVRGSTASYECPPGTGPYNIAFYQAGGHLLLTRNDRWWQRVPIYTSITAKWYKTDADALNAFQSGDVDLLQTRSQSATRYRGIAGSSIQSILYSTNQLELLLFNNIGAKWGNLEHKKAVAHAIDRTRLASAVYQNMVVTTDNIAPPGSAWYNDTSTAYQYNPDSSNRMLDALGYTQRSANGFRIDPATGEALTVRLFYYDEAGTTFRHDAAFLIDDMLAVVGIDCKITYFQQENAVKKLDIADFDLFLIGLNMSDVPDPTFFISRSSSTNYSRYRSEDIQKLLQSTATEYDAQKFYETLGLIQARMSYDLPMLPLYYRGGMLVMRGVYLTAVNVRENDALRTFAQANK
ncbi:MAG: ABC transporter substrate-binding protein [Oscillospiraceae bacterium]|nr:ABC transporter substrate-binding protein [Oscillospiraceae bacterium]